MVVKDCYERNKQLVDLSFNDEVRTNILTEIVRAQNPKAIEQVGVRFMKSIVKCYPVGETCTESN